MINTLAFTFGKAVTPVVRERQMLITRGPFLCGQSIPHGTMWKMPNGISLKTDLVQAEKPGLQTGGQGVEYFWGKRLGSSRRSQEHPGSVCGKTLNLKVHC